MNKTTLLSVGKPAADTTPALQKPATDRTPQKSEPTITIKQATTPLAVSRDPLNESMVSSDPVLRARSEAKPVDVKRSTKTDEINEKLIRYFIDPKLQVADIKAEIDRHYDYSLDDARANYEKAKTDYEYAVNLKISNEASGLKTPEAAIQNILNLMEKVEKCQDDLQLKMAYTDVKNIFEKGIYTKRPDRDNAVFCRILGATMRMHAAESFIKDYSDTGKYDFHPAAIAIISMNATALISKQLLTNDINISGSNYAPTKYSMAYMDGIKATGEELMQKLENTNTNADVLAEMEKTKKDMSSNVLSGGKYLQSKQYVSKHFYPIALTGDLGLYTFEANVKAFKEGFILMSMARSNRGIHGGTFQEPLVIFIHDLIHHGLMLHFDDRDDAFMFKHLASAIYDKIKNSDWTDAEKKSAFFAAHLLLHESDPKVIANPRLEPPNKSLKDVFDYIFVKYLTQAFNDLLLEYGPKEKFDRTMNFYLKRGDTTNAKKFESREEILALKKGARRDPFVYDAIEGLLSVCDEKTKKILEARIIPGLESKKAELKIIHKIEPDLKIQDFPKAYLSEIYHYKCHNYDPGEAFKAIREFMHTFKEKIYPGMSEEKLDVSGYKDFIELGKGLSQPFPT